MYNDKDKNKGDLCIGSLNVRGLNNPKKRKSVFNWATKNAFDVIFFQETYSDYECENEWRQEWGGSIIFAHGTKHSRGTMILLKPGFECKIMSEKCDNNGRYIIATMEIDNYMFTFMNVYAPNKPSEKSIFFDELKNVISELGVTVENQIIAGGDFNSIFNESLDKCGGNQDGSNIVKDMQLIIDELDLCDIWRVRNPQVKRYTYRQKTPLIQTRLDYFLVSDHCQDIILDADIISSVWSDHSGIVIKLCFLPQWPRGKSYWKFNSNALKDEAFIKTMIDKLEEWKGLYNNINDLRVQWELIKYEIRRFCIKYGREQRKCKNVYTCNLLQQLNQLERTLGDQPNKLNSDRYESIKHELKQIEIEEARGSIIRSKANFIEEGEKPTRYFFNLEKRNAMNKNIKSLILPGGTKTTNPEEILEYQKSFYQSLYTSKRYNASEHKQYFLTANITPLTPSDKLLCEGEITKLECEEAIKKFKPNKSPGNDGITIEFYKQFWPQLGDIMFKCFNYSYEHGEMTVSQRQAIITLIEKYGKDKLYIKNWRPISLLNVDYKIASKVLSLRVKKVLPNIIHTDQTGYVDGRQIFDSIRSIQDILEITKSQNLPGMMLLIDFEKAFDSLEWDFLYEALCRFNFGNTFIKWVKLLYTNISSCIMNNGTTTQYFPLTRGARQGDPLSGYLFIIAIECLSQRIRADEEIHGIKIGEYEIKLTQYVDDMTVFVSNRLSAQRLFAVLDRFKLASGLQMNIDKTEGLWLGRNKNCHDTPFGIKWPKEPVKVLGVYFSYDKHASERCNFVTKLEQLTRQLHWWKARDLSLLGKVLIVKTIGLSKFTYIANVLHIPEKVIQDVNKEIYGFLWNGKTDKVKRSIVIQDYEHGGLKMASFDMCIKSTKIKWIKKYLESDHNASWKITLEYMCKKQSLRLFIMSDFVIDELPSNLPLYYKDTFMYWKQIKSESVDTKQDLNDQFVWYNKHMKINNTTVYCNRLFNCGLWNVNDLYSDGVLIPFNVWMRRGAMFNDYLLWRGIINAIPETWKLMLTSQHEVASTMKTCKIEYKELVTDIYNVTEKQIKQVFKMKCFNKMSGCDNKAKCKYNMKFNIDENAWNDIYILPFRVMVDNKLIELQYKILHRIIATNKLLHKMGKIPTSTCDFCYMYVDTIEHLFFDCINVKNFWFQMMDKFNVFQNHHVTITCKDVLLYVDLYDDDLNEIINILCLYGKKFIMLCKARKSPPTVTEFVAYMMKQLAVVIQVNCKNTNVYRYISEFITSIHYDM